MPPELAEYRRTADRGAMRAGADHGRVSLIKAPGRKLAALKARKGR